MSAMARNEPGDHWRTAARRFATALVEPGGIIEVRLLRWNKFGHTASGYFNDSERLADAAFAFDGVASVYATLNEVDRKSVV